MATKIIGKVVKDYLTKYPVMPSLTLAKMIASKEGYDVETVRTRIRYYRGASGVASRYGLATNEFITNYSLPEPDNDEFLPFEINAERLFIMGDIHLPFHDVNALMSAIDYGAKHKPDAILLNGDILDCYQLSYFLRDSRKKRIKSEIEQLLWFLEELNEVFKDVKIYYKIGNHEERIEHYLMSSAPELLDVVEYKLEKVAQFDSFNCTEIRGKRIVKFGGLSILHGHEILKGQAVPVNPARTAYLRATESVLVGHTHKSSEHSEVTMSGELITAWSVGCLCYLHPQYAPINKWNHGFSFVVRDGKNYNVNNKRIHRGVVL